MKKINLFEEYANNTISSLNEATRSTMMMDGYKVTFSLLNVTNSFGDLIVFTPKTSIDLDVIDGAYLDTDDAAQDILSHLNKQFKEVSFIYVPDSPAAGYSFKINQTKLVNKIK